VGKKLGRHPYGCKAGRHNPAHEEHAKEELEMQHNNSTTQFAE